MRCPTSYDQKHSANVGMGGRERRGYASVQSPDALVPQGGGERAGNRRRAGKPADAGLHPHLDEVEGVSDEDGASAADAAGDEGTDGRRRRRRQR